MASCSHDDTVKFWDLEYLLNDDGAEEDQNDEDDGDVQMDDRGVRHRQSDSEEEEEEQGSRKSKKNAKRGKGSKGKDVSSRFFDDIS